MPCWGLQMLARRTQEQGGADWHEFLHYVIVNCSQSRGRAVSPAMLDRMSGADGKFTMSRYCLVVVRTPLVAQDLALTLQDLTGCTPIVAETFEEAGEKLAALASGSLLYAFVQSDAAALRDAPLRNVVERMGARLVLIGHAAEMEAANGPDGAEWPVLEQPFGPAQVADLLEDVRPLSTQDE